MRLYYLKSIKWAEALTISAHLFCNIYHKFVERQYGVIFLYSLKSSHIYGSIKMRAQKNMFILHAINQ